MSKQSAKSTLNFKLFGFLFFSLILIGWLLVYKYGWIKSGLAAGLLIVCVVLFRITKMKIKRRALMERYGDENLVHEIEQGYFWKGQTAQQLLDALGEPDKIDEKVLKTKTKSVWKYGHRGGRRYGLRITLDDLIVTGWEKKD